MADLPSLSANFARDGVIAPQDIRDLLDYSTAMRTTLVAIQELHKREDVTDFFGDGQVRCANCHRWFPCETRNLADEALDRMARTNQGGA